MQHCLQAVAGQIPHFLPPAVVHRAGLFAADRAVVCLPWQLDADVPRSMVFPDFFYNDIFQSEEF